MASFTLNLPVQEKGERIDKFIRRFELVAIAYDWDDAKQMKMFPALVCDEKVIAQIEGAKVVDKSSFIKLKQILLDFPREDVRKWIKELRVDLRDPEKTAAELSRLVEMAYEDQTKQKIKDRIVRDILVDKLPDYLYKETIGKEEIKAVVNAIKNKTLSARSSTNEHNNAQAKGNARTSSPTESRERVKREFGGKCYVCGTDGHMARDCGKRGEEDLQF